MGWTVLFIGSFSKLPGEFTRACSSELFEFEQADTFDEQAPLLQSEAVDLVVIHRSAVNDTSHAITQIRDRADIPIIVMADSYDEEDLVAAFDAGASDYIYPQWTVREGLSRIRAHLRRSHEYGGYQKTEHYELGPLTIDVSRHAAHKHGEDLHLTPKEFDLLLMLASNAEKTVPREDLLREVWEVEGNLNTRTLDVHVGRLRQKIEDDPKNPRMIITVPGVGYRLRIPQ